MVRLVHILVIFALILMVTPTQAGDRSASFQLGLGGGVSYYTGELNTFGHFKSEFTHFGFGGIMRKTFNDRHAIRATGYYGRISGNNAEDMRITQGLTSIDFTSRIIEGNAVYEFNFFPLNPYEETSYWLSPFIYVGAGAFYFSPKTDGGSLDAFANAPGGAISSSKIQPVLPFGFGWKVKFTDRIFIHAEYGLRKTFTDQLDAVSGTYGNAATGYYQIGFERNKDWYSVAMVVLSVRLGRKNTDCHFQK